MFDDQIFGKKIDEKSEYDEIKITKFFRVNNHKLRVSYIPYNDSNTLSIKVTNNIFAALPCIIEVAKSNKYSKIKIYLKNKLNEEEYPELWKHLVFKNYSVELTASFHSQGWSNEDLLCVLVRSE